MANVPFKDFGDPSKLAAHLARDAAADKGTKPGREWRKYSIGDTFKKVPGTKPYAIFIHVATGWSLYGTADTRAEAEAKQAEASAQWHQDAQLRLALGCAEV